MGSRKVHHFAGLRDAILMQQQGMCLTFSNGGRLIEKYMAQSLYIYMYILYIYISVGIDPLPSYLSVSVPSIFDLKVLESFKDFDEPM